MAVKHYADQAIGTVTNLDALREFEFLESIDGRELYVLRRVIFGDEMDENRPQASTVKQNGNFGLQR